MNDKILSHDGGQPVFADDLTFLQNSLKSYINAIAKTYGDTYILHGVLDDSKTTIVPGAIVVNGVLYEVPALGEINGQKLCFKSVDYDPRVYENGSTNNVKNKVDVYLGNDTAGTIAYVEPQRLKSYIEIIKGKTFQVVEGEATSVDESIGWKVKFKQNLDLVPGCIVLSSIVFTYGGTSMHESVSVGFYKGEERFYMQWYSGGEESGEMNVDRTGVSGIWSRLSIPQKIPTGIASVIFIVIKP